jgi:hypothetical protein
MTQGQVPDRGSKLAAAVKHGRHRRSWSRHQQRYQIEGLFCPPSDSVQVVWGPIFSLGSQHVLIERKHSNDARGLDVLLID